jgi:hypothetical protein
MSKLINEVIKVVSCGRECPFYELQDEMLTSNCNAVKDGLYFDQKAENLVYHSKPYLHPNCPLRAGKIMVELKKE